MNFYEDSEVAGQFLEFLESNNGRIQKKILLEAVSARLPKQPGAVILDAACGSGWLAGELSKNYASVEAFDSSPALVANARQAFSHINFLIADASGTLPYGDKQFDCVILNMASHDLEDQPAAFKNFFRLLKPGGQFIMTLANPYYAFPVGIWKRGWIGALLGKKPKLLVRPYNLFRKNDQRAFQWKGKLTSRFYPLSEQINNILKSGLQLAAYQDLASDKDNSVFDVSYQLRRFPLILLLEFKKPAE